MYFVYCIIFSSVFLLHQSFFFVERPKLDALIARESLWSCKYKRWWENSVNLLASSIWISSPYTKCKGAFHQICLLKLISIYRRRSFPQFKDSEKPCSYTSFFRGHILLRSRHGWVCACTMDILILWKLDSKVIGDRCPFSTVNYLKALKHSHERERERCSDFSPLTLLRIWHRASFHISWLPDQLSGSLLGTQSWFHESPGSSTTFIAAIAVEGEKFTYNNFTSIYILSITFLFLSLLSGGCFLASPACVAFGSLFGFFDLLASGSCGSVLILFWHILAMLR